MRQNVIRAEDLSRTSNALSRHRQHRRTDYRVLRPRRGQRDRQRLFRPGDLVQLRRRLHRPAELYLRRVLRPAARRSAQRPARHPLRAQRHRRRDQRDSQPAEAERYLGRLLARLRQLRLADRPGGGQRAARRQGCAAGGGLILQSRRIHQRRHRQAARVCRPPANLRRADRSPQPPVGGRLLASGRQQPQRLLSRQGRPDFRTDRVRRLQIHADGVFAEPGPVRPGFAGAARIALRVPGRARGRGRGRRAVQRRRLLGRDGRAQLRNRCRHAHRPAGIPRGEAGLSVQWGVPRRLLGREGQANERRGPVGRQYRPGGRLPDRRHLLRREYRRHRAVRPAYADALPGFHDRH